MTNVIPSASPRAGFQVQSSAPPTTQSKVFDVGAPQLYVSHAISAATWYLHQERIAQRGLSHD